MAKRTELVTIPGEGVFVAPEGMKLADWGYLRLPNGKHFYYKRTSKKNFDFLQAEKSEIFVDHEVIPMFTVLFPVKEEKVALGTSILIEGIPWTYEKPSVTTKIGKGDVLFTPNGKYLLVINEFYPYKVQLIIKSYIPEGAKIIRLTETK